MNTLRLPACARAAVSYTDAGQLPGLLRLAQQHNDVFVLGGGSNVVLGPDIGGLVIRVASRGIRLVEERDDCWVVEAQAGEAWHDFVAHCLAQGWPGLENLALIPGTVGAAPVQNIGAYGVEFDQRFDSLDAWDFKQGRLVRMTAADCGFSYRHSVFKEGEPGRWLITAVRLRLPKPWRPVLDYPDLQRHPGLQAASAQKGPLAQQGIPALQQAPALRGAPGLQAAADSGQRPVAQAEERGVSPRAIFDAVCEIRRRKLPDPAELGNAGSFFKNPIVDNAVAEALRAEHPGIVVYPQADGRHSKLAAGWMIDRAGWKGRRLGPVGTHERQALVLVNHGGATAADVGRLAAAIRADVRALFGVTLEQEPVDVPGLPPGGLTEGAARR